MRYLKKVKDFLGSKLRKPKPVEPKMTPQEVRDILRQSVDMSFISYVEYLFTAYEDVGYECSIIVYATHDDTVIDVPFFSTYTIYRNGKLNTKPIPFRLVDIYANIIVAVNGTFENGCDKIACEIVGKIKAKYPNNSYDGEESEYYNSDNGYNYTFKLNK